jgi:hypothetical protein
MNSLETASRHGVFVAKLYMIGKHNLSLDRKYYISVSNMGYNNEWVRRCGGRHLINNPASPPLPSPPLMYNAAFMRFIT